MKEYKPDKGRLQLHLADNSEYIVLFSLPLVVIAIFLALAIAYSDFSIGLISSIFLATWLFVSFRYIKPRIFVRKKPDI